MAKSPSRPATGARAPEPDAVANPTPEVGNTPDAPATPAAPEPAPLEFEAPPAMRPAEPKPDDEMITVETTGDFMLVDTGNLQQIPHDGPKEVILTEFVKNALDDGRLKKA